MSKWIAEFELEDGDTMPEHMDLNYMGAKIDFHCRPMWIPVSEGLPYIGQRVLVTTETLDNGKKVTGTYYDRYGFVCGNVLAWMPLPKPFEPQESEDKE